MINYDPIPSWMSEEAIKTLYKGYIHSDETPLDMWQRVAKKVSEYIKNEGIYDDLLECLYKGFIGLATPVAANYGREGYTGLPISCFANHIADDLHSIYSHLKETAALSKYGGGTASYFGDIRSAGSPISGGGTSTGAAPWLKQYDLAASVVTQGNTRRGSTALYLPIDHPDLPEILRKKDHTKGDPRQFIDSNIAVTITDTWLNSMLQGDIAKKIIFDEVLKIRLTSGSPYLIFIDNANKQNPECYTRRGLSVKTSNLCCLGGDTLVTTSEGTALIKDLVGKTVMIYDGNAWVENSGFKLVAKSAEVYDISLNIGTSIRATYNHRWFVKGETVFTEDLKVGDYLEVSNILGWGDTIQVTKVTKLCVPEPVYCTTVPTTGKFALACGVVTGNSEIFLHTDEDHTFVCVLSSLNLLKYPEWKSYVGSHTGLTVPQLAIYLLDAVVEEFVEKASTLQSMGRAVRFAKKSRALGLGTLGLAALYQKLSIPFASPRARSLNVEIHKFIHCEAHKASRKLAAEFGEPEWCQGSGMRNTHLIAIAPTRSNSVICGGISQGVEPIDKNYYIAKQSKGSFVRKNPFLTDILDALGKNTYEVWNSISENQGSVQHLSFLSPEVKEVFKTAREIDQFEIIHQAAERQPFVCQGQSINLFVDPVCSVEYLYKLHLSAWKLGLKSLYYLRSTSELISSKFDNSVAKIVTRPECPYCVSAKEFLKAQGIEYKEYSKLEAINLGFWDNSLTTVPQIWYNNEYIGGYSALVEKYSETNNECEACHA